MMKRPLFFTPFLIFIFACAMFDSPPAAAPAPSNGITPFAPLAAQTALPLPSRTPTPTPNLFVTPEYPRWVMEFADPLLRSLEFRPPDFADDFPPICLADDEKKWKICREPEPRLNYQYPLSSLVTAVPRPTLDLQPDLQIGYALRNTGWFYEVPGSKKNPHLAQVSGGALILRLPTGNERRDFSVYQRFIAYKNFVLQFDIEFLQSEPYDTFRFQFQQPDGGYFALDLTKNKVWTFHWGRGEEAQFRDGRYDYFALAQARVLILAKDEICAFYINNTPVEMIENCRQNLEQRVKAKDITFHLLGAVGYDSVMTIDNVSAWNLDAQPAP